MATKRLEVLITGNAKDAQRAFGDLEKSATKSGKKTESSLSKMHKGLIGLGVGAAALGSFKAFEESEKISRQTAAVIKSTGGTAQVTADHIGDLAGEMSKLGGVDDELVQQGANMLLTFTNIRNEVGKGNDIFDQATLAANNYAAATGTDVVNANKMLGKALNDPIKGLSALSKAGVSFTQQQKDQIAAMVASGDTMGAQKIILAEFSKEYGGSLEANATASGKAQVAMENLGESAGAILAPGLELLAGAATSGAEALSALPEGAQQAIIGIGGITTAAVIAGPKVVEMAGTMKDGAAAAKKWGASLKSSMSSMSGLGTAAALGGAAVIGLGVAFNQMQVRADRAKNNVRDLQEQIAAGLSPADAATTKFANTIAGLDGGFEGLHGSSEDFRKQMQKSGIAVSDVADIIKMSDAEWNKMKENLVEDAGFSTASYNMVDNLSMVRDATQDGTKAAKVAAELQKELGGAVDTTTDAMGAQAAEISSSFGLLGEQAKKYGDVTGKVMDQVDAMQQLNAEMQTHIDLARDSVGAALSEREAHDRVQDSQVALAEARATNDPEQIQRAQDDLTQSILGEAAAADEAARKSAELAGKQYGASESAIVQKARLQELATQTGFNSNEMKWFAAQLDNAARQRQISIDTSQSIANIRDLIDVIRNLSEVGSAASAGGSMIDAGVSGALANLGRASGGPVSAGGFNLVGERGPELVKWGASGTVIPAGKTKQMLSGTSVNGGSGSMAAAGAPTYITVHVQGNVISNDDLLDAVETGLNKRGRRDGRTGLNIIRGAITV